MLTSVTETKGALYLAYGPKAKGQAAMSIASLHRHAPDLPVVVVTDAPFGAGRAQFHILPDADPGVRAYKTQMYWLSPFDKTLFLDADTEVRSSPQAGFNLLGYVDLVLGQDLHRVMADNHWRHLIPAEVEATAAELGTAQHMYFNSGVVFFGRSERLERMMAAWGDEWNRFGKHDQMALMRAIHKNPVRIAPMRSPWNTRNSQEAAFVYHRHHVARREGAPQ